VLGPDLLKRSFSQRFHHQVSVLVDTLYYPVLVFLLLLGLTTFFHIAPPRRLPWHRGLPGAVLAILIFLAGSAGLRSYIHFILDHNHAYTALAAPIAALLFFFVLALGVLLGAEFNAAIEQLRPAKVKPPRVLDPRNWHQIDEPPATAEVAQADDEVVTPTGTLDAAPPEALEPDEPESDDRADESVVSKGQSDKLS
jgi:membrane protein